MKLRDVLWALNNLEEDMIQHTVRYVEDFRTDPSTGATYDAGYYIPTRFQAKLLGNLATRFYEIKESTERQSMKALTCERPYKNKLLRNRPLE